MLGLVPLQVVAVAAVVTIGAGLTVTVIVNGVPAHNPVVAVGVTMYSMEPGIVVLGLINT